MQLVSAIKMKKAQAMAIEGKPYQQHIEEIIKEITPKIDPSFSSLVSQTIDRDKKLKILSIVISTNKGLCGSFNFNLLRYIIKNSDLKITDFVVIGKKASLLSKFGANIIADYTTAMPVSNVSAIFEFALKHFIDGSYDRVFVFYNEFISTLKSEPMKTTLLPVSLSLDKNPKDHAPIQKAYEYSIEPSPEQIIDSLLKSFVEEKIRYAVIQSEAGEHSSRMIAMKSATDNATEVIFNLTSMRNKIRQEKITSELLDMITAKESVESN